MTERDMSLIVRRFANMDLKGDQPDRITVLRECARQVAITIGHICPESPERTIAISKLEESIFWSVKAIMLQER
jgi:hypothetical protein